MYYSSNKTRPAILQTRLLTTFFEMNKYPFSFIMYSLCTTGFLHCGIWGIQLPIYTFSLYSGHVQLCAMSVSNPLVTSIHKGTTCVNMIMYLQNWSMCVLKDIVVVKHFCRTCFSKVRYRRPVFRPSVRLSVHNLRRP